MPLVTCENLTLSYDGVPVVEGLDFTVNPGDYLCIVGENGSGKSTLIKALLGLKKPSAGRIIFDPSVRKDQIGYLPQKNPLQGAFPATVREVVLSGCLGGMGAKPFYGRKEKQRAESVMEKLDIKDIAGAPFRSLSGGQQQRALLARALCATGRLLLMDEPVAGLDPIVTGKMYDTISQLNKDGITIIMVSHDISAAVTYASHILHINNDGKFFGTAEEYEHSPLGHDFLCGLNHETHDHAHMHRHGAAEGGHGNG